MKIFLFSYLFCFLILFSGIHSQINPFENSESGYIQINQTTQANFFYWYFQAESNPQTAPIILWLEGGPGISGLFQVFFGMGPFRLDFSIPYNFSSDLNLFRNNDTWRRKYNLLFVDNPIGVGFSYAGDNKSYPTNQVEVGYQLYQFLQIFFTKHSELQSNPFFIAGESYGGKFVPAVANTIIQNTPNFNFKSIIVGDPLIYPYLQAQSWLSYGTNLGLVDEAWAQYWQVNLTQLNEYFESGNYTGASEIYYTLIMDISSTSLTSMYQSFETTVSSSYFASYVFYQNFVNTTEFRKQLNVYPRVFPTYGAQVEFFYSFYQDVAKNATDLYVNLIRNKVPILFYNGMADWIITPQGLDDVISLLVPGWDQQKSSGYCIPSQIPNYPLPNPPYGTYKTFGGVSKLLLKESGHFGTHDAPNVLYTAISQWIDDGQIHSFTCPQYSFKKFKI